MGEGKVILLLARCPVSDKTDHVTNKHSVQAEKTRICLLILVTVCRIHVNHQAVYFGFAHGCNAILPFVFLVVSHGFTSMQHQFFSETLYHQQNLRLNEDSFNQQWLGLAFLNYG
jgi:hypothetical protein